MKKAWMVVGLQWGDEGKGAEIDRRSREDDVNLVVRCMGGNNAGHTTVYKGKPLVLHLLPSSVAYGKRIGIGAGVIVDPFSLINEIVYVQSFGLDPIPCLTLDLRAAMVMVYHRVMDIATEIVRARQGKSIGTTGRGIGPTYSDYASREALRIYDLLMSGDSKLCQLIEQQLEQKTQIFRSLGLTVDEWKGIFAQLTQKEVTANKRLLELQMVTEKNLDYTRFAAPGNQIGFNTQEICCSYLTAAERLADWQISGDVTTMVIEAIRSGQGVLIEGAQGAMLDNYFGTYPFVTSSHTIAGGACIGLGIGPSLIGEVRGITKAYTTRVGNGPFPSLMAPELATQIRGDGSGIGDEFGASTGRSRECGWFDAVIVRSACRHSGVTKVTLTKLDKLSGLTAIPVAYQWSHRYELFDFVPANLALVNDPDLKPAYLEAEGWQEDIRNIRHWSDLPEKARRYVEFLETHINEGAVEPIGIDRIGVGPGPDQFIDR